MGTRDPRRTLRPDGSAVARRLGFVRRRLVLFAGLSAVLGVKMASDTARPAQADGRVIGAPLGYAPYDSQSDGVQGYAVGQNNAGALGRNNDLNGVGVYGVAPNGVAVHGESAGGTAVGARSNSGYAVYATSTSGFGAVAESSTGTGLVARATATGHGIVATGSGTGYVGVVATSPSGYGVFATTNAAYPSVQGNASSGIGLWGETSAGTGVVGRSTTNGTGVYGQSTTGDAVVGVATAGRAAHFVGPVLIEGSLTVTGSYPKSAAVPHPDGSLRRMYCVESPESLFEDSGSGQLTGGRAQMRLDADFAAVVKNDAYQVFLTPEGDCNGLYVTAKTPSGFEVREMKGGISAVAFSYRVLAKRKDLSNGRMEKVTAPAQLRTIDPSPPPPPLTQPGSGAQTPGPTSVPATRTP